MKLKQQEIETLRNDLEFLPLHQEREDLEELLVEKYEGLDGDENPVWEWSNQSLFFYVVNTEFIDHYWVHYYRIYLYLEKFLDENSKTNP